MLTRRPGLIFPATPVAASIMMAISCSPAVSSGRLAIMSVWSSEPFFSGVTAIFPSIPLRSVTAVLDSHRFGIATFSTGAGQRLVGGTSSFSS